MLWPEDGLMSGEKLDAADVLNWEYMVQIGEQIQSPKSWREGARRFAYLFVSTGDRQAQNTMLADLLSRATDGQSTETVEEILEALALSLHANRSLLKEYAKQIGIRVRRQSSEEA